MSVRPPSPLRGLTEKVKSLFVVRTAGRTVPPRLRGKLRRAVVVPTPDPMFSEAVFILRDECTSTTEDALPPPERLSLRPAAAFLLGAAVTLLLLWALGVL